MRTGSSKSALELCTRISKIALLKQTGGMIIFAKEK
jgi:hypothetical protein